MGGLVYFSSGSGNTQRFVERLDLPALRLPLRSSSPLPSIETPFVLICPTYADGNGHGAVPKQVIRALNDVRIRNLLRGVIAAGNRNFGSSFAMAGDVISRKTGVPVLYRFELAGTETDVVRVQAGLRDFWRLECSTIG